MLLSLFRMTCSAIHRPNILRVGKFLAGKIGMAPNTGYGTVNRSRKLFVVDEHRNRPALPFAHLCLVAVAHQAVGILLGKEQRCPQKGTYQ